MPGRHAIVDEVGELCHVRDVGQAKQVERHRVRIRRLCWEDDLPTSLALPGGTAAMDLHPRDGDIDFLDALDGRVGQQDRKLTGSRTGAATAAAGSGKSEKSSEPGSRRDTPSQECYSFHMTC